MTTATSRPAVDDGITGSAGVVLTGLRKRYGQVQAVDRVDLQVVPGEVVALLGPNGAGKSTTIDLLLGLTPPDEGRVRLWGLEPAADEAVPAELRELFGWVVREGITNVVRHSRASHVRVTFGERSIEVADDGRGMGELAEGNGLRGLRERAGEFGARMVTGQPPAGGFLLRVEVPATAAAVV